MTHAPGGSHTLSSMLGRSPLAVVVAVAALLVAGCGGSDDGGSGTSPTTEWADGLCSAITTWTSSISSIGDTLTGGNLSKDSLTSAVDEAKTATETFSSDLDDLGTPDTDAGGQAKDAVDKLSTELEDGVATIEGAIDGVSGVSDIVTAVSTVSSTLVTMGNEVGATISGLEDIDAKGELESAFEQAESCAELGG